MDYINQKERKELATARFRELKAIAGREWVKLIRQLNPVLPDGWDLTMITRIPERNSPEKLEKLVELLEQALSHQTADSL